MKILFTNARDESNMKEWVAYHFLIGFDRIHVFDHLSETPLSHELSGIPNLTLSRIERPAPVKIQLMAFATNMAKTLEAEWMLYLDADEFLVLNGEITLDDLLKEYKYAHAIGINWLLFGSNGHVKEPKGLLIENYTKSNATLDKHVKTIVRPNCVRSSPNPHFYIMTPGSKCMYFNAPANGGQYNEWPVHFSTAPAFIAHYAYQAEEVSVRRKLNRPRDDTGTMRASAGDNLAVVSESFHKDFSECDNFFVSDKYAQATKEKMRQLFKESGLEK